MLSDNNTTELVETGKSPWGNKRDHLESKTPGLGWPGVDNTGNVLLLLEIKKEPTVKQVELLCKLACDVVGSINRKSAGPR